MSNALNYYPPPTLRRFMNDSTSFVRVVVGPIGSGKSMGCIMELLRRAREQEPFNGVRYTRFAIVRNTLQQLRTTVLADIQQYLGEIMTYFVTDSTIRFRLALSDGTFVHSDWLLIPLDSADDQRRLLSMQLTGAWINEIREVNISVVNALLGRLRRYPSAAMGGRTWSGLIADTNPWDTDSPYHELLVLKEIPRWKLYHQPSGLGPEAENLITPDGKRILDETYYQDLVASNTDEWVAVHVESQFGSSNAGQAVFRRTFKAQTQGANGGQPWHVVDMDIIVNPYRPLMVGLDFGRTPCALIAQEDGYGRLLIFKEVVTEDMGIIKMLQEELKPVLLEKPFAGNKVFVIGDPAGRDKSQVGEESPFDVLRLNGLMAIPAPTNNIDPRLRAVEKRLLDSIVGQPAIMISRTGCPTLIRALANMYRYRRRRDGQLDDLPEKLHPWSDVVDALQYLCLGAASGITGRVIVSEQRKSSPGVGRRRVSARGWT